MGAFVQLVVAWALKNPGIVEGFLTALAQYITAQITAAAQAPHGQAAQG